MPEYEIDIEKLTVDQLDELAILAFSGVEGVDLVDESTSDNVAEHGVNSPEEQV